MGAVPSTVGLLVCLALCFGAAGFGALYSAPAVPGWYATLQKPSWNPPGWVFGPVWTVLYAMMAVAAWRVWRTEGARGALALFALQLVLNAAWSPLFFGLHRPDLALLDIVALWVAIVATLLTFRAHDPLAAWLLVPYLAWVSFATALNAAIWRLNP